MLIMFLLILRLLSSRFIGVSLLLLLSLLMLNSVMLRLYNTSAKANVSPYFSLMVRHFVKYFLAF